MGPIKALLVYAQLTHTLDPPLRRRVAVKAVVGLLFIMAGKFLLDLFHFSIGALTVAGGVILFIFTLNMILSGGGDTRAVKKWPQPDRGFCPGDAAYGPADMYCSSR